MKQAEKQLAQIARVDLPRQLVCRSLKMPLKQRVEGASSNKINKSGVSENTETSHSNYLVAILSLSSSNE